MCVVRCALYDVRCPLSDVRCPMSAVRCPMPAVRCAMSAVRCPMSDVRCTISAVRTEPRVAYSYVEASLRGWARPLTRGGRGHGPGDSDVFVIGVAAGGQVSAVTMPGLCLLYCPVAHGLERGGGGRPDSPGLR